MTFRQFSLLCSLVVPLICGSAGAEDKDGFADTFDVKREAFSSTGRSDFVVLEPGYQLLLEAKNAADVKAPGKGTDKSTKLTITVLPETEVVAGVETRVVEAVEVANELPRRSTRHFLAIDRTTGDAYTFGRAVDRYDGWRSNGHGGSWRAGENGAKFALFMPAKPRVGQKYYQSLAGRVSSDRAEVTAAAETVRVPANRFSDCVKVAETTPQSLKRKNEKAYAPGVGLLYDGPFKLVRYGTGVEPRPDAAALIARAKAKAQAAGELTEPVVPLDLARTALAGVGADAHAEQVWMTAINDPALSANQRSDLIEDLNEEGFADPNNVSPEELPIVVSRLALIEQLAPEAMDDVNADAFAEAYKDLVNIARKLGQ